MPERNTMCWICIGYTPRVKGLGEIYESSFSAKLNLLFTTLAIIILSILLFLKMNSAKQRMPGL